jgi:hypothetical protein
MVHIRPPSGSHTAPPSFDNSSSIEIFTTVVPSIVDVPAPTVEFIEPPPVKPIANGTASPLLWGVAGAAVLVVGGVLAVVWTQGEGPAGEAAPVAMSVAATTVTDDGAVQAGDGAGILEPPITQRDPYAVDPAAASANTTEKNPVPPALPELPREAFKQNETDIKPDAAPIGDSAPPPPVNSKAPESSGPVAEEGRPAVLSFDPLDFDPSQLRLAGGASSGNTPAAGSITAESVGDTETAPVALDSDADSEMKLSLPARDRSLGVRRGPMPGGGVPRQIAQQLAMRVDSFDVSDVPLSRFVEMLSDMADVPITIDPVALELAGKSPRQQISVSVRGVSLEKVLRDALAKHRLEITERDEHVRLALTGGERRQAVDYDVRDLFGSGGAGPLVDIIERFVAPTTWTRAGGAGTISVDGTKLRIEHVQGVRHEVLIFCERLRMARGLPARSRYPAALLSADSAYKKLAPKFKQRTTFTFLPWTRLADVLRYWQEEIGVTIVADWASLADAELGPSAPIACSAIDRTWQDALDGVLEPLGLAWWAVNGETIQITSREALNDIQRIEFYAVPKSLRGQFASNGALLDSLIEEVRTSATDRRAPLEATQLELDKPSGRLIVLATPQVHRFLSRRLHAPANNGR